MPLSKADIYEVLRAHEALIVHFSGCPKGIGIERKDHMYPNDLNYVLCGNAKGGVSCSTVKPGDNFSGINRNATGCVGVLLGLRGDNSLRAVSPDDCGSYEEGCVRKSSLGEKVTIESVSCSITNRGGGSYNEWIVADYDVLGVFVVAPYEVSVLALPPTIPGVPAELLGTKPNNIIKQTSVLEVCNTFPSQAVFGFENGKLCRWEDGVAKTVLHSELYDENAL